MILKEDFCLSKDEMRSVDLDEVFNTHAKAQSDGLKDQIRALCVLRCLISPFSVSLPPDNSFTPLPLFHAWVAENHVHRQKRPSPKRPNAKRPANF